LDKSEWHKKQIYIKIGKRNCNIHWPYTRSSALSLCSRTLITTVDSWDRPHADTRPPAGHACCTAKYIETVLP